MKYYSMYLMTLCVATNRLTDVMESHVHDFTDVQQNELVDQIVSKIEEYIQDPCTLPGKVFKFDKTFHDPFGLFSHKVSAWASIDQGSLKGLSTLIRFGNASVKTDESHITVQSKIRVKELMGSYRVSAGFKGIVPNWLSKLIPSITTITDFVIKLSVKSLDINFEANQAYLRDSPLTLSLFKVTHAGKTWKIGTSTIGDVNVAWFAPVIVPIFQYVTRLILKIKLKEIFQDALNQINLFDQGDQTTASPDQDQTTPTASPDQDQTTPATSPDQDQTTTTSVVDITHGGNANDYADEILKKLRVSMINGGMDPLILPIKSFEFSKTILGIEIRGTIKVYDGFLQGFSSIHRTGLASMTKNDNSTTIRATVGCNDLSGSYKASAKFMNVGPHFNVKLDIKSVGIAFEIKKPLSKESRPTLLSFRIEKLGEVTTEIDENLNILDFILNTFNKFVINIVRDVVALAFGPPMKIILQEILNTVDLPELTN